MFTNTLVVAFRRLRRNKAATAVNILGLSLGISCSIMIAVLLRFELSFDSFYPKADRLYRVVTDEVRQQGRESSTSASPGGMAEALMRDIPGVEEATFVFYNYDGLFAIRDGDTEKKFQESSGVVRVQPEFFDLFDISLLEGSVESLRQPNTAILASSVARRFFGDTSPIGKTIRWDNTTDLTVVGIAPDPPVNTHIQYSVIVSGINIRETDAWVFNWRNLTTNVQTYVLLHEGVSPVDIEAQFPRFKDLYMKDVVNQRFYHLQPISEAHFNPEYSGGIGRTVSHEALAGLGIIGLFLILTSCVNFINMATAQAANRAREIGVRKVLGAYRKQVALQFLGETFLIVLFSLGVSIVIVETVFPALVQKIDIPLGLNLVEPALLGFMAILTVSITLLAGLYPAFVLSGFLPAPSLKGTASTGGLKLRRALVVFQFVISQMLIVGTIVVAFQMDLLRNQDLGLNPEGVVVMNIPEPEPTRLQSVKNELLQDPHVLSASFSWNSAISGNVWDTNVRYAGDTEEKILTTDLKFADVDYLRTYGLTLIAGRNVAQSDTIRELVVNEEFTRRMGLTDPALALGVMIKLGRTNYYPIVGVVRDFNVESLHEQIRPCLLTTRTNRYYEGGVRINTADLQETLAHIERVWTKSFPHFIFHSEFLDKRIESFYEQEQRTEFLFRLFSSIAIAIGCIGLAGLVSYVAIQKTKEVGVRKVLGASVGSIFLMFSKEFVRLILIAFVAAVPFSYYIMNGWLENFAYRITLGPLVFLVAVTVTIAIAVATIGYRALKAATANPVEALKYE